ncbi:restriction endonuclease [Coleofasciculus sp. FACHB-SPT36]|uniref:McrC family protein n=1 Tax=Cyanophyceae TaxID=3028117 RepID=UPI00168BE454|nr:restriction endonuclease [Coleofasciculus sp. FACHB-SPT36]MBD2537780.1 restriction endonuclease [Coleofasciculus sp. FACHB-SPT36]
MNPAQPRIIELIEYEPKRLARNEIPESAAVQLYQNYKNKVDVEFPNYKTGDKWQLKANGWVGYIPLTKELGIKLQPKVIIKNLFGMLEYAYHLNSFRFLDGLIDCQALEEFYSRLAYVLSQRVLDRGRKGFYRAYLPKIGQLAYVRGRLDVRQTIQKPWDVKLKCHYEEHTADIEENQILAWTLFIIGRSGLCSERVLPKVRQAYHALQGSITLKSYSAEDCIGRRYNRLNEDYRLLHALCRFFLDNCGATHERGDRTMLPFLVDMAKLYELFVAEWLKENTPLGFVLKQQYPVTIGQNQRCPIDLILCDRSTGAIRYVLDTKYKAPDKVEIADIHQMRSYAMATKCNEAVLIYPKRLNEVLDSQNDEFRLRSLTFSLDGDLDQAGQKFLQDLLADNLS